MRGSASIANGMWPASLDVPVKYAPDSNPYIGHRMTIPVGMDKVACDCGEPFDGVVDLERHQQRYRHPGISSGDGVE
jgi:hypothetical protein